MWMSCGDANWIGARSGVRTGNQTCGMDADGGVDALNY
jgi:hypothetical protein